MSRDITLCSQGNTQYIYYYSQYIDFRIIIMTWQSDREAGLLVTVLSFPPSSLSLRAVFTNLSAPIRKDVQINGNLLHEKEVRQAWFSLLSPSVTNEVAIDQT